MCLWNLNVFFLILLILFQRSLNNGHSLTTPSAALLICQRQVKPERETSARPDFDQMLRAEIDDPDNFTSQMDEESLPRIQFTPPL